MPSTWLPPDLGELGRQWLGRCEDTDAILSGPGTADARIGPWIKEPRRYGLHATLKAPFRLREGRSATGLDQAVRALAREQASFGLPLTLRTLRGFLAWCCTDPRGQRRIHALADTVVAALDEFRAPPNRRELTRRKPMTLTALQRQMLKRWGYPYVFDTFTFHITLTEQLDDMSMRQAEAQLSSLGAATLHTPMPVNAISVYVEPEPGANFIVARHYGFDGTTRDGAGAPFLVGA